MLKEPDDVKEAVIHDAVYVVIDGVFPNKGKVSSLLDVGIEEKIVVDVVALVRVAAPDPSVALDSVKEALAAVEVEGVGAGVPDLVE